MEKLLSKKIKEIISDCDEIRYINNVKSSLYFVSKLIYINRFLYKSNFNEFIEYYSKNMKLFDENSVLLFKEYNEFNFFDKSYEIRIVDMLKKLKENTILNCKNLNCLSISKLYENLISDKERKVLGQVYTPDDVIENMVQLIFENTKINLNTKILDPACGGGYFLLQVFKKIKEYIDKNKISYNGCVEKHILENMIYGVDIDRFSTFLTKISLIFESNVTDINMNIFEKDFLIDFYPEYKFDIIIGNPPYIGHKNIDKEYSCALKDKYSEVFYDKSDISYCFFKASHILLQEKGTICFITSRYFLEAKYADKLRSYIKDNLTILKIFDYNGQRVFKNAIVSPMIILLKDKNTNIEDIDIEKYNQNDDKFVSFSIKQNKLNRSGWMLLDSKVQKLYEKINEKCNFKLSDLGVIKQGIITGYDKAFIVTDEEIYKFNLEKALLKKWIKNSNITNNGINYGGLYVLYTNLIDDENKYPNTIAYLQKFKDRLSSRRECKNGVRKWYELQWGRDLNIFENDKIIFPYKAKNNIFFYDTDKYLCSADVYSLIVNEEIITYSYILNYLNSRIFEFCFKCNAKKVGERLYEYYPNKLENMHIFIPEDKNDKILTFNNKICVDNYLEKMFNITVEDKYIIEQCIKI